MAQTDDHMTTWRLASWLHVEHRDLWDALLAHSQAEREETSVAQDHRNDMATMREVLETSNKTNERWHDLLVILHREITLSR